MGGIFRSSHEVSCKLYNKVVMLGFKITQNKDKILDGKGENQSFCGF